jgi:hypothetical protein
VLTFPSVKRSESRVASLRQFPRYTVFSWIDRLVKLARHAENESVKLGAIKEILDRSLGKAPQNVDITALRHTEIVYHSAAEIRQALLDRGVPPVLLDYVPPNKDDEK